MTPHILAGDSTSASQTFIILTYNNLSHVTQTVKEEAKMILSVATAESGTEAGNLCR